MTAQTDAAVQTVAGVTQKLQFAIRATPDEVWRALTDGEITPANYVGFRAEFDLTPGGRYRYTAGGGDVITGTVLAVRPGLLLQTTFNGYWDQSVAQLQRHPDRWGVGGAGEARSHTDGPTAGLRLLDDLAADRVERYQPYWVVLAYCRQRAGEHDGAVTAARRAVALTTDDGVRRFHVSEYRLEGP